MKFNPEDDGWVYKELDHRDEKWKPENEWHEKMLDMMDRLGAESWPYIHKDPTEMQNVVYDHVRWLEKYERGHEASKMIRGLLFDFVIDHHENMHAEDIKVLRDALMVLGIGGRLSDNPKDWAPDGH